MVKEEFYIEELPSQESDYTTERDKPMPNRIHGRIQLKLGFLLELNYGELFDFESEVALHTAPKVSTPDICIYPKGILRFKDVQAKATEMPLTTIEIQSPPQAPEWLVRKAWESYFPAGVKSAWVIIPSLKAVRIMLPDNQNFLYMSGELHDPSNDIRLSVDKIFEGIEL